MALFASVCATSRDAASNSLLYAYVGMGGCDVADNLCVPPPMDLQNQILVLAVDERSGDVRLVSNTTSDGTANWVRAVGGDSRLLLATGKKPVGAGSVIQSFRISERDGALEAAGRVPSIAEGPVYVDVSTDARIVAFSVYEGKNTTGGGGTGSAVLGADGSLSARSFVRHPGSSVDPSRQTSTHPHSVRFDPKSDGEFAYQPDLGTDHIYTFRVDRSDGSMSTHALLRVSPGFGPRHLVFHPTLDLTYVLNEMGSVVTVHRRDVRAGTLSPALSTHSTNPKGIEGFTKAAELLITRDGRHLYASNRGNATNTIAAWALDAETGGLGELQTYRAGVSYPRGMALDPTERFLYVLGQGSGNLVMFARNAERGTLDRTGFQLEGLPTPVTIDFARG